jgi:hypothetical protein
MSSDDRPKRSRNPEEAAARARRTQKPPGGEEGASPADFGSFVSSSVRDSFQRLKRDAQTAQPEPTPEPVTRRTRTPAESARRSRHHDEPPVPSEPSIGAPVGRKWRDALPGGLGSSRDDGPGYPDDADTIQPGRAAGFDLGLWFRETFFDEDGPNRKLWAAIGAAIIIILLVIYLIVTGGDGNEAGGDVTPTPTTSTVLTTDRNSTPETQTPTVTRTATKASNPQNQRTPEPTATSGVREGGDNQRG